MIDTPAPLPIEAMTPAQATAALAALHAALHPPPPVVAPADAQDARARLDVLSRDASFANALFSGSIAARQQFDSLIAAAAGGDDVADAVAGIVEPALPLIEATAFGSLPRRAIETTIAGLRDAGLNDATIAEAINLPPVSRAEFMAVQGFQAKCHGDAEWRGRLLSGDYEARRQHTLICVVLSSPIAEDQ
jgi:hypothetical protein